MKTFNSRNTPPAVGPYSHAVIANSLVFLSGQIGLDPQTGNMVEGGIAEQTTRALKNLETILTDCGSSFDKVVSTSCFLTNISDFQEFNEIYAKFFDTHKPTRTTVEVSNLPKSALVEISLIAQAK